MSSQWPRTGHREIDRQHAVLFALVERARTSLAGDSGSLCARRHELRNIVADLAKYIIEHFAYEERLMASAAYPDAKRHVASHRAIHAHVAQVIEAFNAGQDATGLIGSMLDAWLHHHIGSIDQELAAHLLTEATPTMGSHAREPAVS